VRPSPAVYPHLRTLDARWSRRHSAHESIVEINDPFSFSPASALVPVTSGAPVNVYHIKMKPLTLAGFYTGVSSWGYDVGPAWVHF
jgi:hypothetical protein